MKDMIERFFKNIKPTRILFLGYLSYSLIGSLLLSIPIFNETPVHYIDNLFTAVSAISTTGLTTVSTPDSYSFWGELLIILLIQVGGLGYMTFGSFIILSTRKDIPPQKKNILETSFSLPKEFEITKFIRSIVLYTFIIELIGAILLFFVFWGDTRTNPFWSSIFHSISAFCTAGFSLYNNSFENFSGSIPLNIIVSVLSILGAIGYIVFVDIWLVISKKKDKITFTTKIILFMTFVPMIFAAIFLFFLEPLLMNSETIVKIPESFFQAMTALTTVGFNTVPIGELSISSLVMINILMVIGASPSGTGGGIKSTTITSILGLIKSVLTSGANYSSIQNKKKKSSIRKLFLREKSDTPQKIGIVLFGKNIPIERVLHAVATFCFYIIILSFGVFLLSLTQSLDLHKILFEASSALGTVGLSMGITSELNLFNKIVIIIMMFIGRVGPITFGMAIFYKIKNDKNMRNDDIVV